MASESLRKSISFAPGTQSDAEWLLENTDLANTTDLVNFSVRLVARLARAQKNGTRIQAVEDDGTVSNLVIIL